MILNPGRKGLIVHFVMCWLICFHTLQVFTVLIGFCLSLCNVSFDKTYNKICVTSKDSIQPARLHSLFRVFTDCMCLLQPPGYPKREKKEPLPYLVDAQAGLSGHTRLIVDFVMPLLNFLF